MKPKTLHIGLKFTLIAIFLILLLPSCRTQKEAVYNPIEVQQLSRQMGFNIGNTDKNIPLYAEASFWLDVPYRHGGSNKRGIDCSGLVNNIYRNLYSKNTPRSTSDLVKATRKVSKSDLKAGDLVFFATSSKKKQISHVGIFLKDGYFIHASTSRGVIVSHLNEKYYVNNWVKGGRL